MAKEKKKRASTTAQPAEGAVLGSTTIPVQVGVVATGAVQFNELLIEWACLGLSQEPDKISENSGNARLLDPNRPPYIDAEGLHVYFDPSLPGGTYGFQFLFTYADAVQVRTSLPPVATPQPVAA